MTIGPCGGFVRRRSRRQAAYTRRFFKIRGRGRAILSETSVHAPSLLTAGDVADVELTDGAGVRAMVGEHIVDEAAVVRGRLLEDAGLGGAFVFVAGLGAVACSARWSNSSQ